MLITARDWLMRPEFVEAMAALQAAGFALDPTAHKAFIERTTDSEGPKFVMGSNGIAHIPVVGALTNQPDFFFSFFGGGNTVYGDIIEAIRAMDADDEVESAVLEVSSPGGEVAGFYDTAAAIAASSKPIVAHITDMAASAAYGLAAQTDFITLNNRMAIVGSVGIITTRILDGEHMVTVRSTKAPKKQPDASTSEGVKAIKEELDAIHAEFAGVIAEGRGVSVAVVNKDYGRGGLVVGAGAVSAGMVDAIFEGDKPGARAPEQTGGKAMDLETLKAEHPAVYAAALALGVTAGITQERTRVEAHVIAGEAAGPEGTKLALGFIKDGSEYTNAVVQATYNAAATKAAALGARSTEDGGAASAGDPKVGGGTDDEAVKAQAEVEEDGMLARVAESVGIRPDKLDLGKKASAAAASAAAASAAPAAPVVPASA